MQTILLIVITALLICLLYFSSRIYKICDRILFEIIQQGWEHALSGNFSVYKQGNNGSKCCDSGKN